MKKMIILLGCVWGMMLSCSKEEPTSDVTKPRQDIYEWQDSTLSGDAEMGMKMLFNVGDSISVVRKETTRATTTIEGISTFDENDIVTIALTSNKQASDTKNYKVKSNKTSLTNAGSSDGFAWKSQTEVVTLTAWSYGGGVADLDTPLPDPNGQEFTLEADQQANGYKELLYSHERSVSYLAGTSGGGISLPMYHQLARVVITLSRKATDDAATVTSVTIGNGASSIPIKARFSKPTAEQIAADVHTGTWTVTERSETAAIRAKVETANTVYSAVLIPDNYASGIGLIRVTMSDGNVYTYTTDSNVSIEAGMQYNYSVSIGNDVATLEAVYPTEWTASGYPISSYNLGETFGVYVYNGSTPVYSNIPMTAKTTGTTVELDAGSYRPHLSTSYTYYIYYPYRANPGTVSTDVNNAADFFADVISGWTIDTSQGTTGALRDNDLQISMISPTASNNRKNQTVTATMAHKAGLAVINLGEKSLSKTIVYTNNVKTREEGSSSIAKASSAFSGFIPYNIGNDAYLYLIRPNVELELNSTTGDDQWKSALTYNIASGGIDSQTAYSKRSGPTTSIWEYTSGAAYTFNIPEDGNYFIQCWGAAGGTGILTGYAASIIATGTAYGHGAYTSGYIDLTTDKNSGKLYVYVGDVGTNGKAGANVTGGYNGGGRGGADIGSNDGSGGGGGATDIRLTNNATAWSSRIMVAGGGGGGCCTNGTNYQDGMHAGAPNVSGTCSVWGPSSWTPTVNQAKGNALGVGAAGINESHGSGGGGGGYYGGTTYTFGKGAGGSSFISGASGCATITGYTFETPQFIKGTSSSCPSMTIGGSAAELGCVGGYARITLIK